MAGYDESKRHDLSNDPDIKGDPLDTFKKHFPTSYLDGKSADLAIYLGGYNANGEGIGEASSYLGGRHAWAQMVSDWLHGYDGSRHGRRATTIHELGHFFDADHEGSDGYKQAYDWWSGLNHYYTVMWSTNKGSKGRYEFSSDDYNGDSTHDNARRINETKGVVANYNIPDCPLDMNGDGYVNAQDIVWLLTHGQWGYNPGHVWDLNGDDYVNAQDVVEALTRGYWGACP